MKTSLCLLLSAFSMTAFAQKVDFKTDKSAESILKASTNTFLNMERIEWGAYHQAKLVYSHFSTSRYYENPYCLPTGHDLSLETVKLLGKTPIESLEFKPGSIRGYTNVSLNGTYIMVCDNLGLNPHKSLSNIFHTTEISAIHIKGTNKDVKLLGVTEEEKPEAIVEIDGAESLISCDDLLFDNVKYGSVETGLSALTKDYKSIVKVVTLGPKIAKVEKNKSPDIVWVADLIGLRKSLNFDTDESVYVTGLGAATVKGDIQSGNETKTVVEKNGEIKIAGKTEIKRITGTSGFTKDENVFVKLGDKKVKAIVVGGTEPGADQQVLIQRDGELEAVPASQIIRIKKN